LVSFFEETGNRAGGFHHVPVDPFQGLQGVLEGGQGMAKGGVVRRLEGRGRFGAGAAGRPDAFIKPAGFLGRRHPQFLFEAPSALFILAKRQEALARLLIELHRREVNIFPEGLFL
jgi:hypothetical protein